MQVRDIGRPGWPRLAFLGSAALVGLALPVAGRLAAPAVAAQPCRPSGGTVTCEFPAGPARTWQVPDGVVRLAVTVTGSPGPQRSPGSGGTSLSSTPGAGTGPGGTSSPDSGGSPGGGYRAILSGFRLSGLRLRLSPGGASTVAIAPPSGATSPAAPPSVASLLMVAGGGSPVFPAAITVTDGITVTPAPALATAVSGGPAGRVTVSYTRRRTALTAVSAMPAAGTSAAGPALLASARLTVAGLPVSGQPVAFTVGGAFVCTAVTGSGGVASCRDGYARPLLRGPWHGITAVFRGGLSYQPSAGSGRLIRRPG